MINRVTLTGRLTKDLQLKKTNNNESVCSFTLAVDRYKNGADFPNIVAWRQSADYLCKYAHKGDLIALEGRIQTRSYDGVNGKVYVTEVLTDNVQLCTPKKETQSNQMPVYDGYESNTPKINDEDIDNLPFY